MRRADLERIYQAHAPAWPIAIARQPSDVQCVDHKSDHLTERVCCDAGAYGTQAQLVSRPTFHGLLRKSFPGIAYAGRSQPEFDGSIRGDIPGVRSTLKTGIAGHFVRKCDGEPGRT